MQQVNVGSEMKCKYRVCVSVKKSKYNQRDHGVPQVQSVNDESERKMCSDNEKIVIPDLSLQELYNSDKSSGNKCV